MQYVLLKNNGVLPLKNDLSEYFLTGPNAASIDVLLGNYYGVNPNLVTILEGVSKAIHPASQIQYKLGAMLSQKAINPMDWSSGNAGIADVTIAVLGISSLLEGEEGESLASATAGDRLDYNLPENQLEYLRKLRNAADNNPNDKLSLFNLENSIEELTLNKTNEFNVYFYLNDSDAENDTYNQYALPTTFKNTVPNQILTAKVLFIDSDCHSLGKVELIANPSLLLNANDVIGCDLGDGNAEFDFVSIENEILNDLNLTGTISIFFYENTENAMTNTNPLPQTYVSSEKLIFFKVEKNGICYGAGSFNLKINYFPPIELTEILAICNNQFPTTITANIPIDIQQNYTYIWSTGENTHDIEIKNEQQLSVKIIDKVFKCEKVKYFDIKQVSSPIITDINININNQIVTILTKSNFNNVYSIDNPSSEYQSENSFLNVTPGIHTVYIKDIYDCDVTVKNIFVLGFPKFFTPNNDGINDSWGIKGLDLDNFTYSNINIFDRFGKHLLTLNPKLTWNGVYNSTFLNSNDYWFTIDITDKENIIKSYKGHFSLIRK